MPAAQFVAGVGRGVLLFAATTATWQRVGRRWRLNLISHYWVTTCSNTYRPVDFPEFVAGPCNRPRNGLRRQRIDPNRLLAAAHFRTARSIRVLVNASFLKAHPNNQIRHDVQSRNDHDRRPKDHECANLPMPGLRPSVHKSQRYADYESGETKNGSGHKDNSHRGLSISNSNYANHNLTDENCEYPFKRCESESIDPFVPMGYCHHSLPLSDFIPSAAPELAARAARRSSPPILPAGRRPVPPRA